VRDGVLIDPSATRWRWTGLSVLFTATEFRLLQMPRRQPGRVFTREQLINHAIGEDAIIIDATWMSISSRCARSLKGHRG